METQSLELSGNTLGEISIDPMKVTAQSGLSFPILHIPITLRVENSKEYSYNILNINSLLTIESKPVSTGFVNFQRIWNIPGNKIEKLDFTLNFGLDIHRVKAIEDLRRGDQVLTVEIEVLIATIKIVHNENSCINNITEFGIATNRGLRIQIPSSYWIQDVLPRIGLGKYHLIEMPEGERTVKSAWEFLDKAEYFFNQWNIKEVFDNARMMGDKLDTQIKKEFKNYPFILEQRWGRAFAKFNHWASIQAHEETTLNHPGRKTPYDENSINVSKADAEMVLITAKALIKFAEELIREKQLTAK